MKKYAAALSATAFAVSSVPAMAGLPPVTRAKDCRNKAADVALNAYNVDMRELRARKDPANYSREYRRISNYWFNQRQPELTQECQSYLAANPGSAWVPPEK